MVSSLLKCFASSVGGHPVPSRRKAPSVNSVFLLSKTEPHNDECRHKKTKPTAASAPIIRVQIKELFGGNVQSLKFSDERKEGLNRSPDVCRERSIQNRETLLRLKTSQKSQVAHFLWRSCQYFPKAHFKETAQQNQAAISEADSSRLGVRETELPSETQGPTF